MITSAVLRRRTGKLAVWAGETAAGGTDPSVPLLVLAGALAFVLGALLGGQISAHALRERDQRLAEERRLLNRIWFVLRSEFGIEKPPWVADMLDRRRTKRHSIWFRRPPRT